MLELVDDSYELYGLYDLEERKEELIHNEIIAVFYSEKLKISKLV